VGPVLEEAPLVPEQAFELRWVVPAEAAPEHEQVTPRDDADRVELEAAELADERENAVGARPAEPLFNDGQPPRLLDREL
jgi:hypothetical protein